MAENKPRVSFESNQDPSELEVNKNIKLDNKKSRFTKQRVSKQDFDKKVEETHERVRSRLGEMFELGKRYKDLFNDKTITENKTYLLDSKEKEVIGNLVDFALILNEDHAEREGIGSVSLTTLLLKCMLIMRDRFNDLDYKIHLLERENGDLREKLTSLSSKQGPGHEDK